MVVEVFGDVRLSVGRFGSMLSAHSLKGRCMWLCFVKFRANFSNRLCSGCVGCVWVACSVG